jgi:hypothetical protein
MDEHTKAELAAELDRARAKLSRNMEAFRRDIDVPAHLRSSFRDHKSAWIGAAAILGLLAAKIPARKKKIYVAAPGGARIKKLEKAGIALALAKMAFSAARPAIVAFVTKKITDRARHRGRM